MKFAGDKKKGMSLFGPLEKKIVEKYTSKIPKCVETYHLTMLTVLWSGLIVVFGVLARDDIRWLWLVSLMIAFQYVTDLFDGAVGRYRNTGLVKWGYYMDHFLDYIFLCSILIAYMFIVPDNMKWIQFFILALFGAFMVNSYLSFASTNEFKIEYLKIGPTEVRLAFIIVNTLWIIFGHTYLQWSLPFVLVASILGLTYTVYNTQKYIWAIDMKEKNKK